MIEKLKLNVVAGNKYLDKEITGGYCCDLLSWVMSHAKQGFVWITVQVHPNIIAVATLLNISCIIVPEGIKIENETIEKAEQEEIPLLSSSLSGYEIAGKLYGFGIKEG